MEKKPKEIHLDEPFKENLLLKMIGKINKKIIKPEINKKFSFNSLNTSILKNMIDSIIPDNKATACLTIIILFNVLE